MADNNTMSETEEMIPGKLFGLENTPRQLHHVVHVAHLLK